MPHTVEQHSSSESLLVHSNTPKVYYIIPPKPIVSKSITPVKVLVTPIYIEPTPLWEGMSEQELQILSIMMQKRFPVQQWQQIGKRSRFVRARLVQTLEKLHVPIGLQALPVVESGYNPYVVSHAGASGLWQLMPSTARSLGLSNSSILDERRHVQLSSDAAVRYLIKMQAKFTYWPLALAAYHCGPSKLRRYVRAYEKKYGFSWQPKYGISSMPAPKVSRSYVKKVIGMAFALHQKSRVFPSPYITNTIQLRAPIDLAKVSNKLQAFASEGEDNWLFLFNPGLQLRRYQKNIPVIHVPKSEAGALNKWLQVKKVAIDQQDQDQDQTKEQWQQIIVKDGDSLWSIAHNYGLLLPELRAANEKQTNLLRPGQMLRVPAIRRRSSILKVAIIQHNIATNPLAIHSKHGHFRYMVRSGDSLWAIAHRFGSSVREIVRANSISTKKRLHPGEVLWVRALHAKNTLSSR
ncbi:MAG: LysM peptidoglycan-binding domain-containing protein [Mariprofundales bacterium]